MSKLMRRNLKVWNGVGGEFDVATACNAPSVRAWDHAITRVSFGTHPNPPACSLLCLEVQLQV